MSARGSNNKQTLIISSHCEVSHDNGWILLYGDTINSRFYLDDIGTILVESRQAKLSSYLITEIVARNIVLVFCDNRHIPCGQIIGLYGTSNSSKRIAEQIAWTEASKRLVWNRILSDKIKSQESVLVHHLLVEKGYFLDYIESIVEGDSTNREGMVARLYFNRLFGKEFVRHQADTTNSALNYGYSLILAECAQIIVSHGYSTQLGLNHHNGQNNYNFACDIMEPFRSIVDKAVYRYPAQQLDREYKQHLIEAMGDVIFYGGKQMSVYTAMESYFLDIVQSLESSSILMKELIL